MHCYIIMFSPLLAYIKISSCQYIQVFLTLLNCCFNCQQNKDSLFWHSFTDRHLGCFPRVFLVVIFVLFDYKPYCSESYISVFLCPSDIISMGAIHRSKDSHILNLKRYCQVLQMASFLISLLGLTIARLLIYCKSDRRNMSLLF